MTLRTLYDIHLLVMKTQSWIILAFALTLSASCARKTVMPSVSVATDSSALQDGQGFQTLGMIAYRKGKTLTALTTEDTPVVKDAEVDNYQVSPRAIAYQKDRTVTSLNSQGQAITSPQDADFYQISDSLIGFQTDHELTVYNVQSKDLILTTSKVDTFNLNDSLITTLSDDHLQVYSATGKAILDIAGVQQIQLTSKLLGIVYKDRVEAYDSTGKRIIQVLGASELILSNQLIAAKVESDLTVYNIDGAQVLQQSGVASAMVSDAFIAFRSEDDAKIHVLDKSGTPIFQGGFLFYQTDQDLFAYRDNQNLKVLGPGGKILFQKSAAAYDLAGEMIAILNGDSLDQLSVFDPQGKPLLNQSGVSDYKLAGKRPQ